MIIMVFGWKSQISRKQKSFYEKYYDKLKKIVYPVIH